MAHQPPMFKSKVKIKAKEISMPMEFQKYTYIRIHDWYELGV